MLLRGVPRRTASPAVELDGGRRSARRAEVGLFLVAVAAPLVVAPFAQERFTAAKLPVMLGGVLALWTARLHVDRRTLAAALAFVAAAAVATLVGADPGHGLLGYETQGNGFALWAASAMLLVVGTGLGEDLRARFASWTVAAGCVVAVVALVGRIAPDATDSFARGMSLEGSTFGHALFVGGFAAFAVVASVERSWRSAPAHAAVLVLLASALALSSNRSAWIGTAAGLALAALRAPALRRRILRTAVVVVVVLAAWTAVDAAVGRPGERLSAASRFGELASGTAQDRTVLWPVVARAAVERPILGWGPGNTWSAYLAEVSPAEMRDAGRGWGDAHNLFLEILVGIGLLGALAFAWLGVPVGRRAMAASPERAWAAGAAVALAVQHLLQPLNVATTPLMFLAFGVAAGARAAAVRPPRRVASVGVAAIVALMAAVAGLRLVASGLERYAREYDSQPAARVALRLDPARLSAAQHLWLSRALDARSRRPAAFAEADRLAGEAERAHPWSPLLRLAAADAALIADRPDVAEAWLVAHIERFPNDPVAWLKRAVVALRSGNAEQARRFAERVLALSPGDRQAAAILAGASPDDGE